MPADLPQPLLSGVVIHWRGEEELAELIGSWPRDPRFELVVVDNSGGAAIPAWAVAVQPGRNLGFGGGANAGVARASAPLILLLNPDVTVSLAGLESLLAAFESSVGAAGFAPRLVGPRGEEQAAWQLRTLPKPGELLRHALPGAGAPEPATLPAAGGVVEQPAAAALALRKEAFLAIGGFDERFYPAWFEDVDLAVRLRAAGYELRSWPEAVFVHHLGSTVPQLGYGPFLFFYYRNLTRYLRKHHGLVWSLAAYPAIVLGVLVRLVGLPFRRPQRASSRSAALRGLLALAGGACSGWRLPRDLAAETAGLAPRGLRG